MSEDVLTESSSNSIQHPSRCWICIFCQERIPFERQAQPDYKGHLTKDHNIKFEAEAIIQKILMSCADPTVVVTSSCGSQTSDLLAAAPPWSGGGGRQMPWFTGCEYQCRICQQLFFCSPDLRDHVKKEHCDPTEYLNKFDTFETKSVLLQCQICCQQVKRNHQAVWNHLATEHAATLDEYERRFIQTNAAAADHPDEEEEGPRVNGFGFDFKDDRIRKRSVQPELPGVEDAKRARRSSGSGQLAASPDALVKNNVKLWFLGCEYRCKVPDCDEVVWDMQDMMLHIRSQHALSPRHYVDRYKKLESKYQWYVCGICQSRVKHQKSTIIKHLATHNMSLIKYTEVFHPDNVSQVISAECPSPCSSPSDAFAINKSNAASDHCFDNWSKGTCKFKCGVCDFQTACSAQFWKHTGHAHNMNIAEYKAQLGNPCIVYNEIQCKGCSKLLRFDPGTLANHASHAHDMSMEEFYDTYFKPEPQQQQQQQQQQPVAGLTDAEVDKMDEEARQWSDQCVYECRICHQASYTNYGSLFDHIRSKHNMTVDAYKLEFGEMASKKIMHHCRLCQVEFLHTSAIMRKHFKRCHDLSITQYYVEQIKYGCKDTDEASNSDEGGESSSLMDEDMASGFSKWKKGCEYECKICCSVHFSWSNLNIHLKQVHSVSADDYREQHGMLMTKKTFHKCFICRAPIIQEAKNLKLHMKKRHNIRLDEYYIKYVCPDGNSSSISQPTGLPPPAAGVPTSHRMCSMMTAAAAAHPVRCSLSSAEAVSFSDWRYACRYECRICEFSTRHSSDFSTHVNAKHSLTLAQYTQAHGKAMTHKVQHKCLICGNYIIQQPQSMKGHITMHALSLEEYYSRYVINAANTAPAQLHPAIVAAPGTSLCQLSRNCVGGHQKKKGLSGVRSLANQENNVLEVADNEMVHDEEANGEDEDEAEDEDNDEDDEEEEEDDDDEDDEMEHGAADIRAGGDEGVAAAAAVGDDTEVSYDEWRHACVYTCKICNHSSKHHADIYSHMLSKHKMTLKEYTEQYGKPMSKEVYHNCHICGKDLLQQSKNIKKHVRAHSISLEKYFEVYVQGGRVSQAVKSIKNLPGPDSSVLESMVNSGSLSISLIKASSGGPCNGTVRNPSTGASPDWCDFAQWKNACMFECRLCQYSTKAYFTFNFHTKDKHGIYIQDYVKQYGKPMTKKVYHRCMICGAAFLQIAKTMTRHLQLHGIGLQAYYDQFVLRSKAPAAAGLPLAATPRPPLVRLPIIQPPPLSRRPLLPAASRLSVATKKVPMKLSKEQRVSKCLSKSPYLTFCWNQCKETCGMCNQIFSTSATLHKHIRFVHNVDLDWYKQNHVTSIDDISTVCLVCTEQVQLTQKAMENHLRSQHGMSLMNYEEQFKTQLSLQFEQLQTIRLSNLHGQPPPDGSSQAARPQPDAHDRLLCPSERSTSNEEPCPDLALDTDPGSEDRQPDQPPDRNGDVQPSAVAV